MIFHIMRLPFKFLSQVPLQSKRTILFSLTFLNLSFSRLTTQTISEDSFGKLLKQTTTLQILLVEPQNIELFLPAIMYHYN